MITAIATMIYRLSSPEIILGCISFWLGLVRLRHRYGQRVQPLFCLLLFAWSIAVIYLTVGSREESAIYQLRWIPFHSYREMLETGNWEIMRSNFMNVVLFYPAGLLLAAILPKRWRTTVAVAVLCLFSLAIEGIQYTLDLGWGEIDDVIHNTLGAVLGAASMLWERQQFFPDINRQN